MPGKMPPTVNQLHNSAETLRAANHYFWYIHINRILVTHYYEYNIANALATQLLSVVDEQHKYFYC